MGDRKSLFGLTVSNIPLINLRSEFNLYYHLLCDDDFCKQFSGRVKVIQTPLMAWYGMPDDLLTLMLQRATLGIEAYLPGAVFIETGSRGLLNKENVKFINNPYLLKGSGTVDNYYHRLPSMLDQSCSLKVSNEPLWELTKRFYAEVRNPLFHGWKVSKGGARNIRSAYQYLADLYDWIDSWHSPDNIFDGASVLSGVKHKTTPPKDLD